MSECTHDCSTCGESCSERQEPQSLLKEHHPEAHIGKVFGIVSGKGGVGKSMVTSQLAVTMRRRGHQVGILDADVTGPSIPKAFGVHGQATGSEAGLYPMEMCIRDRYMGYRIPVLSCSKAPWGLSV